jgi:Family of unknown function (DUF6962)
MKLDEPITTITDYILGIEAAVFCTLLIASNRGQASILYWAAGFAALAVSSIFGGTFHGFQPVLPATAYIRLQQLSAFTILTALILFVIAGIISAFTGSARILLFLVAAIFVGLGLWWTLKNYGGNFAVRGSVTIIWIVFAILAALLVRHYVTNGNTIGYFMYIGALIILIGAAIQQQALSLHEHFNENDLCHVLFIAGLYFLYRGGLLLRDAIDATMQ